MNVKLNKKRCQKCISRINNELLKKRNYYKDYYENNNKEFKEIAKENYRKYNIKHNIKLNKVGRPKNIKSDEIIIKNKVGRPKKIIIIKPDEFIVIQ